MNTEISKILASGKSETVEFKASFLDDALETIGAFANNQGGVLLLGVEDSGKLVGFQRDKKTIQNLSDQILEATEPKIRASIVAHEVGEKSIVVIEVPKVFPKLVSVRGRYFRRIKRINQRMKHEEIIGRMVLSSGLSWDELIEPSATLEDLDSPQIERFIAALRTKKRCLIPKEVGAMDVLREIGLVVNEQPTRAALLLFGQNIDRFFPSAFWKIGHWKSKILRIDGLEVHGSLFEQVEQGMNWLRDQLKTTVTRTEKQSKNVVFDFPLEAVREALINAVCHRDYSSVAYSQIRLYEEHLVIQNAGGLPPHLRTELLLQDHDSVPRNRKIADAFFWVGLSEKRGSGTTCMVDWLKAAQRPAPEFISDPWSFEVGFYKNRFMDEHSENIPLSERQLRGVVYAQEHGKISNSEYQKLTGISKQTASKDLRALRDKGIFELATKGTATSYKIMASMAKKMLQWDAR